MVGRLSGTNKKAIIDAAQLIAERRVLHGFYVDKVVRFYTIPSYVREGFWWEGYGPGIYFNGEELGDPQVRS